MRPASVSTLYQLVYVSSATCEFSSDDLLALLAKSRNNNERNGISGMLLYKDGNFIQVLEGEEPEVKRVFERIARDPRHSGSMVLTKGAISQRDFAGWSMGFRNLNSPEIRELPGYSEFLNEPLSKLTEPSRAFKLLTVFKSRM